MAHSRDTNVFSAAGRDLDDLIAAEDTEVELSVEIFHWAGATSKASPVISLYSRDLPPRL